MSFDLNILVNGNRCKQYHHQGKTFIEAKEGSEYVIQINNNYWKRILAVGSVDGLNVLTGKTAASTDSGYIVGAYSSEKIKGFRFSDDEWAMFRFGYKFDGKTYAQSKQDGSERNCGVIGLKLFYEKEPVYVCNPPVIWNTTPQWLSPTPAAPQPQWITTTTVTTGPIPQTYAVSASYSMCGTGAYQSNVNYCCNNLGQTDLSNNGTNYSSLFGGCAAKGGPISPGVSSHANDQSSLLKEAITDAKAVRATALANTKGGSSTKSSKGSSAGGQSATLSSDRNSLRDRFNRVRSTAYNSNTRGITSVAAAAGGLYGEGRFGYADMECEREQPKAEFDMGTEWGRKERSKVRNIAFDRGCLAQSFDIYYASREALIAMGVPITNELAVNSLPQSFPNGYAQPPAGWVG